LGTITGFAAALTALTGLAAFTLAFAAGLAVLTVFLVAVFLAGITTFLSIVTC
jgi:hypothetical protein